MDKSSRDLGVSRDGSPAREDVAADPRSSASILLVDDSPANLLSLRSILEPLGQKLVTAGSGEEALRQVLLSDFAVILMDVRMPGLDGMKTAQIIRRRKRSAYVPIIFLTAVAMKGADVTRAYKQGAVDFLLKPFEPEILRSKVRVFVDLFLKEQMIKLQSEQLLQRDREALERRNAMRLRNLIDSMPICVLALRPDGTGYYRNQTAAEYLSQPAGDVADFSLLETVCADDRDRVAAVWESALREGNPLETQFRIERKEDRTDRWHLCRIVPQRDEDGHISAWICTAADIERQIEAREAAESANRLKDEFLATVSHELRNPLNAILGWTQLMREGKLDQSRTTRALEIVARNAESQAALIDDLLDVARIRQGKFSLNLGPIDMVQIVDAALAAARPLADAKDIVFESPGDDGAPRLVTGDAERLQQVVWNLLSNAIKFTDNGGCVSARVSVREPFVELEVTDTGQGISPDFLPYIFDRFSQAEPGAARVHSGLGLGLSICREIIDRHHGVITAWSEGRGKGATFTVRLPMRPAREDDLPRPTASDVRANASLSGLKILLVDDEASARDATVEMLSYFGAQVTGASSADDAISVIRAWKPDVLISDIGMPLEDGYSLIRRVRALPRDEGGEIPAGALTGWGAAEEGKRALAAGFQLHMAKPVRTERLLAAIFQLTAQSRPRVDSVDRVA